LLQILAGSMLASEGKISWLREDKMVDPEKIYSHISICAPYLEPVEEMTLIEFLSFHARFKPLLPGISTEQVIEITGLEKARNKQVRHFSSGMKQRVKLAQCIFSNTDIVLLDEPCTNLDTRGIELYNNLIKDHCRERLVIVSSNDEQEYRFCREKLELNEYK
jgi:ABC-type multidrug transport system ATPase subunit